MIKSDCRVLLIDNYDSFTYNIYQYLAQLCSVVPHVVTNDVALDSLRLEDYDAIVLSPGPGHPGRVDDFGVCSAVIDAAKCPILGVCLGHQGLALHFGGTVGLAAQPMHGRPSDIMHNDDPLFVGIPSPYSVIRYHSLIVDHLPDGLEVVAWCEDEIMALKHRDRPIWGVQFHPESIETEYGLRLFANFIGLATNACVTTEVESVEQTESARSVAAEGQPFTLISRELNGVSCADAAFMALYAQDEHSFWLDSTSQSPERSRFSYMGSASGPFAALLSYSISSSTLVIQRGADRTEVPGPCLAALRRFLSRFTLVSSAVDCPFQGGLIGYLGYELKAEMGAANAFQSSIPDAVFLFIDRFLVFDHHENRVYLCALQPEGDETVSEAWFDASEGLLKAYVPQQLPTVKERLIFKPRVSRDEYIESIRNAFKDIRFGDSYEVCLTTQLESTVVDDPLALYRCMRTRHQVPYAAFLKTPWCSIASVSPERFLRIDRDGEIETKPIKGTAPRHRDDAEDTASAQLLVSSEKERSENLMIVDLLRNDLGRVARTGSVAVPKLMAVESYAVHQLVSTVTAKMAPDIDVFDVVQSCFPGGSMTGAPKLRTMDIIDGLEVGPRGAYSGALGFFSLTGSADLSIVIRTLVMTNQQTTLGVGGAIVYLSDEQSEWGEVLLKARSVLDSIDALVEDA
ncbi:MAG: aminodeoxychorismate synthase component I [Bradymonadia bacterium]